jgi:hypothetical protein
MRIPWHPTHLVTLVSEEGAIWSWLVMLRPDTKRFDGSIAAVTHDEATAGSAPRLRMSKDGAWTWNGRPHPEGMPGVLEAREISGSHVILPDPEADA